MSSSRGHAYGALPALLYNREKLQDILVASLEVVFPVYSVNLDKVPATPKQLLDVTLAWPLPRHSVTSRLIATLFGYDLMGY